MMKNTINDKYIEEVLQNIDAPTKFKKRIEEDLKQRIAEALDEDPLFNVYEEMGTPFEVSNEFMENLEYKNSSGKMTPILNNKKYYEYKSEKTLFGFPIIHINIGGKHKSRVAKGIIAIGDLGIGVIAIGGVAMGPLSIGGVSLGGIALGGVSLGLIAIGGVANGLFAIGGIANGIISIGGLENGSAVIKTFSTSIGYFFNSFTNFIK